MAGEFLARHGEDFVPRPLAIEPLPNGPGGIPAVCIHAQPSMLRH
jgi:hypothetical protein